MKITVIGAGAWGTALANLLRQNTNAVTLWGHNPAHLQQMEKERRNEIYLPGIPLADGIQVEPDLATATAVAECIVLAVPSRHFRETSARLAAFDGLAVSVTKGIECDTGLTMTGILRQTMPKARAAVLSGPTLALEVARGIPAAIVAAHADSAVAKQVQKLFHQPAFRVYTSEDVAGVELGGALKNVVAIAAGIGDGVGYGDNAKAGLVTRAIAEMRRLGVKCGASADTFSGLSGLGDLTVTCFSRLSRNRQFGERVGKGETVDAILRSTVTVAEGYPTALAAHNLSARLGVEIPIIDEVYAALYGGKSLRQAVRDLLGRDLKRED